jgi:hypothetical protein
MWWVAAAASVVGGLMSKSASDKSARRAIEVGKANAADLERITALNADEINRISGLNADSVLKTANLNGASIMEVGMANAKAYAEATIDNIGLEVIQSSEMLRRHAVQELQHAGEIRAAIGASGVRGGQGSPLEILHEAVTGGYGERQYMARYAMAKVITMGREGQRRVALTKLEARSRAQLMTQVAGLQASVMREEGASRAMMLINDAEANAASLRRGGQLIASQARAQGTASLVSGIMGGFNTYMKYGYTG